MLQRLALMALSAVLLAGPAHAEQTTPKLKIVASFSILGDMIQTVGGDDIELITLVGPNKDAHSYQPTPNDVKALAGADIIAINGLKFEGWMTRLITASGSKAKLLVTSAGVRPRVMTQEEAHGHAHHHEAHKGDVVVDPHAWQDLRNSALYVKNIAAALIAARPEIEAPVQKRAEAYLEEIKKLDQELREAFSAIPETQRKVITSHDAFGYFGAAYGVTFLSPAGLSTEDEPSAAGVARLIEQIKAEKVSKLFVENAVSPRLIEQLAKDTGAALGGALYADTLSGPSGPAPTYLALMRHNANLMLGAMR